MKKLLLLLAVCPLSFSLISSLSAQSVDYNTKAADFIRTEYGLDQKAIGDLKIKDHFTSTHNGVEHVHLVQVKNGYEIFGTEINLAFQPNGKISSVGHRLTIIDGLSFSSTEVDLEAPQAIGIVAGSLGIASRSVTQLKRTTPAGIAVYDKSDMGLQDIPAELGYLRTPAGDYHLTWKIQFESAKSGLLYQSFVDATNSKLISNDKLTSHCSFEEGYLSSENNCDEHISTTAAMAPPPVSGVAGAYRVLPLTIESPNHGDFQLITGIEDITASPFGWHDTDGAAGAEFTITQGNNVHAFLDRDWSYSPDSELDGGADLTFDFPFNIDGEPVDNESVAVTGLFVRNNFMHDFAYSYGFTEAAGNFQSNNYTGALGENDYVNAHAQFGDSNPALCGTETNGGSACQNNADFGTPIDGFNGRMRMFTWNQDNSSKFLEILTPIDLSGKIQTGLADFGADITSTPVTGPVVEMNDGSFNPTYGCVPLDDEKALEGKIVIIDRGLCDFSEKAYIAQESGAIGVIICNFDETVIGMTGANNAGLVTIPSVFISKGECSRIRIAAANGLTASLVAPVTTGPTLRDGSLDNSIISHEYGHGISTRLTGGPGNSSCLNGSALGAAEEASGMGEGWSDFFALVTTVNVGETGSKRRGIGTYAIKETVDGRGIRTYPYSTDMAIDPHTYDDIITEALPHGVGSVWAAMLWDMYWDFSDAYGWDPDVLHGTGGNNMAIQLVMDGLKLQPCPPGFIDARDAILQADAINNGGANQCLIWKAFARRGLGVNADGGDVDSRADGKQGFDLPTTCLDEIRFKKTMTPEVVAGQQIEVRLTLINYKAFPLTNVFIEDPIPDGCTYVSGSANIAPAVGNTLVWSLPTVDADEEVTITYLLQTDSEKNSIRIAYDDMEGDPYERWDVTYNDLETTTNFWQPQDVIVHSGVVAWNVGDPATESHHYLENLFPYNVSGSHPLYRFYHYYNTEAGADGGFLEVSTEEGVWVPLADKVFRNGYPRRIQYATFVIPDLLAFSGLSSTDQTMTPVYIDLSDYIGQEVKVRYRFGTDDNVSGDGWYVDDVEVMDAVIYNSEACMTSDETGAVCVEAPERGTIVDTQISSATNEEHDNAALGIMPNPAGDLIQVVLTSVRSEESVINVFDLTGHVMTTKKWAMTQGINQQVIDVSGFTSGMYVIQVSTGDVMYSKKFVKE
ncbi:MAG TPA: M36 family metallopeptidase [Saprospiraceae bacterium]|nr:M36 family metallopeptidase [Saprospiraceae bacterium]